MSTKHTPGPWSICEHSWSRTGIYANHIGIAALDIATEVDAASNPDEAQYEWESVMAANARLIAAAPDLLAALLDIVAIDDGDISALWPYCDLFDNARAAIAKAVGEQA